MKNETTINQQLFNFSVTPVKIRKKPTDSHVGYLKKHMITSGVTFTELVEYTNSPYSYTFSPSTFSGSTISNKTWESQQGFYLDFDESISIDDALEKFNRFGITPNFFYHTLGENKKHILPRFRIVILLKEPIYDYELANTIRKGLLNYFNEADQACNDAGRFFFGGKDLTVLTNKPVTLDSIIQMISCDAIASDHGHTRKLVEKGVFLTRVYNRDTRFQTGYNNEELTVYRKKLENLKKNAFKRTLAINTISILNDFNMGKHLKYKELFGIATNLFWTKGGFRYMKDKMQFFNQNGSTHYDTYDFAIFQLIKHYGYLPQRLSNFSPYVQDHFHTNIINATVNFNGHVEIMDKPELITLAEAESVFKLSFEDAINSDNNNIYLFKVFTGLGKTEALTNIQNQIIYFPTHQLKNEISKRMNCAHTVVL